MHHLHLHDASVRYETGELSAVQAQTLARFVVDRHVHDLGAGNLGLAARMLHMGASGVTAVDQGLGKRVTAVPNILTVAKHFHEYHPTSPLQVALVSWPPYLIASWPGAVLDGIVRLCAAAPIVAYLGDNFGHVCGNPEMWKHLGTRAVLAHVPDPRNTLIVYGRQNGRIPGQGLLPEEKAALYRETVPFPAYGVTYE